MVTPITAGLWSQAPDEFAEFDDFKVFLPNGRAPAVGELFSCADQARSLRQIAQTQGEAFYRGDLAKKFVDAAQLAGAKFVLQDLEQHRADWVDLISLDYHGYKLHEIPPNGQGLGALLALGILDYSRHSSFGVDSADALHCQIEAMKLAFADSYRYISDAEHLDIQIEQLLSPDYL